MHKAMDQISIRFSRDLLNRTRNLAKDFGLSPSELIRRFVADGAMSMARDLGREGKQKEI